MLYFVIFVKINKFSLENSLKMLLKLKILKHCSIYNIMKYKTIEWCIISLHLPSFYVSV